MLAKQNEVVYYTFSVYQTDLETRDTGQAGSVATELYREGAATGESVTVGEIGSTGEYNASFTPVSVGKYLLRIDLTGTAEDSRILRVMWEVQANDLDDIVADTEDIQSRLPAALVGGRIDSDVGNIQTDAVDADALATDAVNEVRDAILSDSTAFDGADIAAILADTDSLDTTKITTARANNLDEITATRLAELDPANLPSGVDDILADTSVIEPLVSTNLDATVSSRSDFDEATDPVEILDTGGTAGTSAAELVTDIEADLAVNHGAGAWDDTDAITSQEVRDAMKLAPTGGAPAVGSVDEHLDDILADTDSLDTTKITTVRANNLDEITAARLAELDAANLPSDVDDILADTDAIDTRLPADPADESLQQASHATTQAAIALVLADTDAIDTRLPADPADESLQQAAHTQTQADIAALNDPTVAEIDTQLSGTHGAGSWETATAVASSECHLAVAYDESGEQILISAWLARSGATVLVPTAITLSWYNQGGTLLFSKSDSDPEVTGPDAQGVWLLATTPSDFVLATKTAYYIEISITDATGTVDTTRGVPTAG